MDTKPLPIKATVSQESSPEVTISTLVIPNVTNNDVGTYYCVVWAGNKASRSNGAKLLVSGTYIYIHIHIRICIIKYTVHSSYNINFI